MIITETVFKPVKTTTLGKGCFCPVCGKDNSLEVEWAQPLIKNIGLKITPKKLSTAVHCNSCGNTISTTQLSAHLKDVIKTIGKGIPVKFSLRPTIFGAILFITFGGAFIYAKFFMNAPSTASSSLIISNIAPDMKLWGYDFDEKTAEKVYSWYLVTKVNKDTVYVKRHKDTSPTDSPELFSKNDKRTYEEKEHTASLKYLMSDKTLNEFQTNKIDIIGYIEKVEN